MTEPQASLFDSESAADRTAATGAYESRHAPLSTRMRPTTLEEFVGQDAVLGEGTVLRRALQGDQVPSLILWGPPGSGKTTLAGIIAAQSKSAFEAVPAVSSGVAELRKVMERARQRQRLGQRTILFIDEIHRFHKAQQDAVLPHVENGVVRLIGATTENPSFEVNAALLSRARVVRLQALSNEALKLLIERALRDPEKGLGKIKVELEEAALQRLIEASGGDARTALDALEIAVTATQTGDTAKVGLADIDGALQQPSLLYDRAGDQHYWVISAFIKSVRGSDADAAIYWLARMLEAGEDLMFVARRIVILAAEDIGLADPQALSIAVAAQQAAHFVGMPEAYLPLAEATLYLASAPKSNSALKAYAAARQDVAATMNQPVPLHLRNAVTLLGREQGFGADYIYAHSEPGAVAAQQYLPDNLEGRRYYEPTGYGREAEIQERLTRIRDRLHDA